MTQPNNVLLIITDQLSWRALPAYGDTYASTPNIDRIAERGVRFSQCYTPYPLCQPARAAFWTGRFPHATGVLSNGRKFPVEPVPDSMPTLGERFARAGYRTMHFGKRHDAGSLRGFSLAPVDQVPVGGDDAWPLNRNTFQDRHTTEQATSWLREYQDDTPSFTVVDLVNPHNICGWVGENAGPHVDAPVDVPLPELPDNFEDADFEKRPLPVQYVCCSHNRLAQASSWDRTNYRHYLAAYYHYLHRVDAEIGRILDALATRPDAEQTLIVFMADHGDAMASHRMVTKQVSMIEETTRVPLMFAGPGVRGEGRAVHGLCSLLDLFPTLCAYAGLQAPTQLWGRSLIPWLQSQPDSEPHPYVVSEWHTEWGYTISPGRMVRTPNYKYLRYLEDEGEALYTIPEDPGEMRTLIDDPGHAEALKAHRQLLDRHLEVTDDPFFSLDWKVAPRWRSHPPGYPNHTGPAAPMVG
jgi:choline-sulfatase